ncbi:MAG: ParB/RepB/Spo0J family partition protein [Acutalibacteraceae bacterium]
MTAKRGGLGRGLEALFTENATETGNITELKISDIEPNRNQPRKEFDEEALSELAESISKYGVLQPLIVRPMANGSYQLVAGERRWRASRLAGLNSVPVIIKSLNDSTTAEIALIENLQREDLSAIEEAQGYQALIDGYGMTQEKVAQAVGKSRPAVANAIRLLCLPDYILAMLKNKEITGGHARALLSFADPELQKKAAELAKSGGTVRMVEKMAKTGEKPKKPKKPAKRPQIFDETELALEETLGRKIRVSGSAKRGVIEIEFYGTEDLKELANLIAKDS